MTIYKIRTKNTDYLSRKNLLHYTSDIVDPENGELAITDDDETVRYHDGEWVGVRLD